MLSALERDGRAQSNLRDYHSGWLDAVRLRSDCLDIEALRHFSHADLTDLLGIWLNDMGIGAQSGKLLREIAANILSSERINVRSGQLEVRQHKGRIYALKGLPVASLLEFRLMMGKTPIAGGVLKNNSIKGAGLRIDDYFVRFRQGGETLRKRRNRSLKNLCQEEELPAWIRPRLPLIFKGEELVAIAGVPDWDFEMQIADGYDVMGSEAGLDVALYLEDRF